jgi:hypothetical protein
MRLTGSEGPYVAYCRAVARSVVKRQCVNQPPVDVESIALAEGFQLDRMALGDLDGRMRQSTGKWLIEVNSARHQHNQRFTIAHEIGHALMGHQGCGPVELEERQANVFAAELLMPLGMLRKALNSTGRLGELAYLFAVSKEAMQYKLNEHGWLLKLASFD